MWLKASAPAASLLLVVACASEKPSSMIVVRPSASSTATPAARPTPVPTPTSTPVSPATMTLDVQMSFKQTTNQLGDPIELLIMTIASNAPQSFEAYPSLDVNGRFEPAAGNCGELAVGCIVRPGKTSSKTIYWPRVAPKGSYRLSVLVPSYSSDPLGGQESSYTKWVGGPQGPGLKGNPLAEQDANHPAVLNLRRVVVASHA